MKVPMQSEGAPMQLLVPWDEPDPELRLMKALLHLVERVQSPDPNIEGVVSTQGLKRCADYFIDRMFERIMEQTAAGQAGQGPAPR